MQSFGAHFDSNYFKNRFYIKYTLELVLKEITPRAKSGPWDLLFQPVLYPELISMELIQWDFDGLAFFYHAHFFKFGIDNHFDIFRKY